jgi:hypothetical protein
MIDVLHVVFTASGAGDLRKAMAQAGRPDRVVVFFDNLSFGPIDPADVETRDAWVEAELGYPDWCDLAEQVEAFWAEALSTASRRVVWLSRRNVAEFTGFLEWMRRNGPEDFELVDLNAPDDSDPPAPSRVPLAIIRAEVIGEHRLWDRARIPSPAERVGFLSSWAALCAENAPLRVLTPDLVLRSAPLSEFDDQLLAEVGPKWKKAAQVVGGVLTTEWTERLCRVSDLVLFPRLQALADSGALEMRGDPHRPRGCKVRRR